MDGTTVFCGSARTGSARGGSRGIAAGDSPSFVIKLMQRWRRRGTLAADRIGGGKRSKLAALEAPARQGSWTCSLPPPRASRSQTTDGCEQGMAHAAGSC